MPPILKRLRKLSDPKSPDLATLLEPYGTNQGEGSADPGPANSPEGPAGPASESSAPDGES